MADELKNALVELVRELSAAGIEVYLGGGYGLYLKQLALLESETRTYIDREAWPRPRATADLDVFLPGEIIIDHAHMARVRKALDDLRYEAVDPKYVHFVRERPDGKVRVELLAGPVAPEHKDRVRVNTFRIGPRPSAQLHAYLTPEALDLDAAPFARDLDGISVRVPGPFSFLLMKLHAFSDRMDEADDGDDSRHLGRHHALDVYRVIAMLTEPELEHLHERRRARHGAAPMQVAVQIVAEHFSRTTALGVLRLREHPLAGDHLAIDRFIELMVDVFSEDPS